MSAVLKAFAFITFLESTNKPFSSLMCCLDFHPVLCMTSLHYNRDSTILVFIECNGVSLTGSVFSSSVYGSLSEE